MPLNNRDESLRQDVAMLKEWKLTECCKSNKNKVQQVPDVAGKCEAMKESRLKPAAQPHGDITRQ